jgi:hypothetical protein
MEMVGAVVDTGNDIHFVEFYFAKHLRKYTEL